MPPSPQLLIAPRVVAWFSRNARPMPWRTTPRDPYAVWLSEVMLQQTRVATVEPYFLRFIERFPTVTALAGADLDEVLRAWSGLGYYRRARALHAAAQRIVSDGATLLPSSLEALRSLPGIGAYTAAAVASIAYNVPVAVVDGNVRRVVARLLAYGEPMGRPSSQAYVDRFVQGAIDAKRPGQFNEAMMELGATVCTPRQPACERCPLLDMCAAHAQQVVNQLPVIEARPPCPVVKKNALVFHFDDDVLLVRRKPSGLFGGLWEPLLVDARDPKRTEQIREQIAPTSRKKTAGLVRHVLTHRVFEVTVMTLRCSSIGAVDRELLEPEYDAAAWAQRGDIGVGVSRLARKIMAMAEPQLGEETKRNRR